MQVTQSYLERHWAKAKPRGLRPPNHIHLLEHHLADVGACFEALLEQPTIRQKLAKSGGCDDLSEATIARLCVFAALHDIGKLNTGFQTQVWASEDLHRRRKPRPAGHTDDLVPVLNGNDRETGMWFFDALGWNDFLSWDDLDGKIACGLLMATFSHHGKPLQLEGGRSRNPRIWQDFGDLSPRACAQRVSGLLRGWFPQAFDSAAPPLPSAPAFQHMFLGLCTLADWIGSNDERWFEYADMPRDDYMQTAREKARRAMRDIGLNISEQRRKFSLLGAPDFGKLFRGNGAVNGFQPNAIQEAVHTGTAPLDEAVVIVESETGSGKTEAALWRFAQMYGKGLVDGIYFALPTRAAADQMHRRVKRFAANLFAGQSVPPVVLAVPGYEADADAVRVSMQEYDEHAAGESPQMREWSSENPKRYLAAQIAVGTIDQALMGVLKVRHAHLRAACLARNLLVVDEVHASDAYMRRILEALLEAHIGAGGYALLMSATLGSDARRRLLSAGRASDIGEALTLTDAIAAPYPAVSARGTGISGVNENSRTKTVHVSAHDIMHNFTAAAETALNAARAGAKVLFLRNTVGHAVKTQQALERMADALGEQSLLFQCEGVAAPHHGRFAAHDRRLLDRRVESYIGKGAGRSGGGCVVVGTQTLEQSLDIDADLLITDLCPVDVLLQRIGRLHRHERKERVAAYRAPQCVVLTPPGNDLSPLLGRRQDANGLGPHGGVYADLRVLEATLRLILQNAEWNIPAMNRELVESATHPDALKALVQGYERQDAELGEKWRVHAYEVEGEQIADGLTARGAIIRRDKSFYADNREVLFGSLEEKIRTRLGDERVDITFAQPQDSPFGQPGKIDKVAMRLSWLSGAEVPQSVGATAVERGFEFAIGDRRFRYDRLGLHRL